MRNLKFGEILAIRDDNDNELLGYVWDRLVSVMDII